MSKRCLLQLACICLLLAAQQAALTHSIWHLRDFLPAHEHQEQAGTAHDHDDDETPSSQAELCAFHAALGTLFAGAWAAQVVIAPTGHSDSFFSSPSVWRFAQSAVTPPSRAPPVLL
jgi:hypothetical protein